MTSTSALAQSRVTISVCPLLQAKWKPVMSWKSVIACCRCQFVLFSPSMSNCETMQFRSFNLLYPLSWHPHHLWPEADWLFRCIRSHKPNESLFSPETVLLHVTGAGLFYSHILRPIMRHKCSGVVDLRSPLSRYLHHLWPKVAGLSRCVRFCKPNETQLCPGGELLPINTKKSSLAFCEEVRSEGQS